MANVSAARDNWRARGGLAALLFVAAGTSAALVATANAQSPSPAEPSPASVAAGQSLYLQSCASCHGLRAEGGPNGPALTNAGTASWSFQLRTGRMPLAASDEVPYRQEPRFDEAQIAALLAFARTVTQGPEIPHVDIGGGNLQRGWAAYVENCAACHAATGAGDAVGGGFIAPSLLESDPQTVGEAILVGPGAMPAFPFLESEIDSIAAYVQQLRAGSVNPGGVPLGGLGPVAEGFVAVVFGLGSLVVITRWIERRRAAWHEGSEP
jgi:ubiquinol-cytochrome c reductase cytochrome c subunit